MSYVRNKTGMCSSSHVLEQRVLEGATYLFEQIRIAYKRYLLLSSYPYYMRFVYDTIAEIKNIPFHNTKTKTDQSQPWPKLIRDITNDTT